MGFMAPYHKSWSHQYSRTAVLTVMGMCYSMMRRFIDDRPDIGHVREKGTANAARRVHAVVASA